MGIGRCVLVLVLLVLVGCGEPFPHSSVVGRIGEVDRYDWGRGGETLYVEVGASSLWLQASPGDMRDILNLRGREAVLSVEADGRELRLLSVRPLRGGGD